MNYYISIIIYMYTSQLRMAYGTCSRDTFFMWQGVSCDGDVIHTTSQNVSLTSCERTCRLYRDCVGFNMVGSSSDIGECSFMRSKTGYNNVNYGHFYGKYSSLTIANAYTFINNNIN